MTEHLTPETAEIILNTLPEKIQLGLRADAAQIEYPIESSEGHIPRRSAAKL